jgi:hypothetical protein
MRQMADVLAAAERYAKGMQNYYVSTEYMLPYLGDSSESKRLVRYGLTKEAILTAMPRQGKLDPIIGRDEEIRRTIQILSHRPKNNPALISEPGVGKTAVVEGLTQRSLPARQGHRPDRRGARAAAHRDRFQAAAAGRGRLRCRLRRPPPQTSHPARTAEPAGGQKSWVANSMKARPSAWKAAKKGGNSRHWYQTNSWLHNTRYQVAD